MMDISHVSRNTYFLFGGEVGQEDYAQFPTCPTKEQPTPAPEETRKTVIGVQFDHVACGEQAFGIDDILNGFGADSNGIIKKIPEELTLTTQDNVTILKYGRTEAHPLMIGSTSKLGVLGYWDYSNFIICASNEYSHILKSLIVLLQSKKAKFAFRSAFGGKNLLILSI